MDKYSVKADVIKTGVCKIVKQYDRLNKDTDFIKYMDVEHLYAKALCKYGYNYIREARRINNAQYKRVGRLKQRINDFLAMGQCVWLTLTFKPSVLEETNAETRRKYVIRYLKSQSNFYIANIDFGSKKGREHYHAIVVSSFLNTEWWLSNCGGTKCILIKNHIDAPVKMAKYVSKLTNHAIKETTKKNNIIYSRYKGGS